VEALRAVTKPAFPPVLGTREHARLPAALLALLLAICLVTGWAPPAGHQSYLLEVVPGLAAVAVLAAVYRRFPMSHLVYGCWFVHVLILVYGGIYTYANTPLGNWARDAFHLSRNHYDRVGHLALGFFPALTIREVLLRRTPLATGGWFTFITLSIVLAIGAFWELIEWWTTLIVAGDVGTAFLGSQGDPWDAQWDMFLALVGAAISLPLLAGAHDRSMQRAGVMQRPAPPA
jgi:putative membrane protein